MFCFLSFPYRIVNKAETSDTFHAFAENAVSDEEEMGSTFDEIDLRLVYSIHQRVIVVITELSTVTARNGCEI